MPLDSDVTLQRGRTWRDLPEAPPVTEAPAAIPDAMTPPPAQAVTGADTVELPSRVAVAPPPPPPAPAPAAAVSRPPWVWIISGVAAVAAVGIILAASPWDDGPDDMEVAGVAVDAVPRRVLPPDVTGPSEETPVDETPLSEDAPPVPENPEPVPIPSTPGGESAPAVPDSLEDLFGGGDFGEVLPPELEGLLEDMLLAPEAVPGDPGLVPPELAPLFDLFLEEGFGAEDGLDGVVSPELQRLLGRMLAGEELSPEDLLWLLGSPEMQGLLDDLLGNG